MTTSPLLEVRGVSKHFPGVQALRGVSLHVRAGEVLAVLGENGAGKSTLMKVLAGVHPPDGGEVLFEGKPVRFETVAGALRHGISLIHQELNLAENLSVSANLFLGREKRWGGWLGLVDHRWTAREAPRLMARVGLDCRPDTRVGLLAPGQRQLVEIARALSLDTRVLIMDEPTSSLTQSETERLFGVIADLKRAGVAILYISHRLAEVQRIADRVTVLRDGQNAGELTREQISHDAMVRLMVGRELQQFYHRTHRPPPPSSPPILGGDEGGGPPPRLEVRDFRYAGEQFLDSGVSPPVSFVLRPGEIVGLAGLVGAGRTELAEALFGIRRAVSGQVLVDGRPFVPSSPARVVEAGIALVPEDRRLHGLVLEDSVLHNISLPSLDRLSRLRLVRRRRERELAGAMQKRLQVRTPSLAQPVGLLSGGNQQKVVLARWLARRPGVLLFDEPTRGIDVGAKSEIYALMDQLTGEGVAILMISSDLEEVLGMSDRVLVLHQGRLAGELPRDRLSEESIMHLATGGSPRS